MTHPKRCKGLPQFLNCPENSLLGRTWCDPKRSGDLLCRALFHVAHHKGNTFDWRQLSHGSVPAGFDFPAQQNPVWPGGAIRHLDGWKFAIFLGNGDHGLVFLLVQYIEGAIHGDPVNPGSEVGPGVEVLELAIASQECLLHDFIRIRLVLRDAEGDPKNTLTVMGDEQPVSVLLSGENAPDERVVVIPHPQH